MYLILSALVLSLTLLLTAEFNLTRDLATTKDRQFSMLSGVSKFFASSLFICFFLYLILADSVTGFSQVTYWVLIGLIFSMLGDLLLIPRNNKRSFLLGIAAFAIAHLAYMAAFIPLPRENSSLIYVSVATAIFGLVAYAWLKPHLAQLFRFMVPGYVMIICAMVISAASVGLSIDNYWVTGGVIIFAISDLFVARNRFVSPGFVNRLFGLPLYYLAQLMIGVGAIEIVN
ncbi:MAG: lysoplasmalogenase [Kangiellaceae bacterium]|nr:lysoplasmalogenase [Kangiellaceae bacterium]